MRYPTVGDYYRERRFTDAWSFRVAKLGDHRYEVLVFLHEMIEFFLCRMAGIKLREIDRFDQAYEMSREAGVPPACRCAHYAEPGDDPHAVYHRFHKAATKCEKIAAEALGVDWGDYEKAIADL